jgi:hypothetical protein
LELLSLMDVAEGDETFNDLHDEVTDEWWKEFIVIFWKS